MECEQARSALRARLAGIEALWGGAEVSDHLEGCRACRDWEAQLLAEHNRSRPPSPDEPGPSSPRTEPHLLQYVLGVVAATEVALGVASILGSELHPFRELAAADIAFAVGCLVAAVQPRRTLGVLPVAVALVVLIIGTGILDLARGVTGPLTESHHLLELTGAVALCLLARRNANAAMTP